MIESGAGIFYSRLKKRHDMQVLCAHFFYKVKPSLGKDITIYFFYYYFYAYILFYFFHNISCHPSNTLFLRLFFFYSSTTELLRIQIWLHRLIFRPTICGKAYMYFKDTLYISKTKNFLTIVF